MAVYKWMKKKKAILVTFVLTTLMASCPVSAQDQEDFTLDPLLVTSQRYEKRDLDIPAMVKVYTEEQLKNTGANTVVEALKFSEGIIYNSQAPNGQSVSSMTSKVAIRGQERGTLILIDGVPINLRNGYSLEDMPITDIEKIEVLKGGGAVLYGSDATGGVINIITKKQRTNSIKISAGSFDRQKHALSLQEGKFGFSYNYDKLGKVEHYGDVFTYVAATDTYKLNTYSNFKKSEKNMAGWKYQFDDNWSISQFYSTNQYGTQSIKYNNNQISSDTDYDTNQNRIFLRYEDEELKGTIFNNHRKIQSRKMGASTWAQNQDKTTGFDLQKQYELGQDKLIVGGSTQREFYDSGTAGTSTYDRMVYSVFANWNHPLSHVTDITIAARETWTGSEVNSNNYSKFTPQLQILHKLDHQTSIYTSVGQSFIMPTFAQLYGQTEQIKGDPNIKPQTGTHYEVGWKKINDSHAWRLAAFKYKIDDFISTNTSTDPWTTENENHKNHGIELSCDINGSNGWSFNWGITYQDLKLRKSTSAGNNTPWTNKYGNWMLNGGVNYSQDKWQASIMGNYLADRTLENNYKPKSVKPMLLTSMRVAYKPVVSQEIYLTVDNIFDRQDITTHSSAGSAYYTPERSFELGYRFTF